MPIPRMGQTGQKYQAPTLARSLPEVHESDARHQEILRSWP